MAFIAPPLALGIEVRPRWIERKQDRQQLIERHPVCREIQERFLHILRAYQKEKSQECQFQFDAVPEGRMRTVVLRGGVVVGR